MIRPVILAILAFTVCLIGCDSSEDGGGQKKGRRDAAADGRRDGKRLNMKFRGQPQAGTNANKRGVAPPGADGQAPGNQKGPRQARLFSRGEDGKAALSIRESGMVVVELLGEDGQSAREIDAARMQIWIKGMGEETVSGLLIAQKASDEQTGASRFQSKPGLLQLGSELQVSVVHKATGAATGYKFRVPADFTPLGP